MKSSRAPKVHELKTWPDSFQAVVDGCKRHELRKNDRDFQEYDVLWLREWDPQTGRYTGRSQSVLVTYIYVGTGAWGLEAGNVIMSIMLIP